MTAALPPCSVCGRRAEADLDAQVTLTRITGESLARAQERLANATQSTVEMGAEILGLRATVAKLVAEREARLRIIASLPLDDPAVVECMALSKERDALRAELAEAKAKLAKATT